MYGCARAQRRSKSDLSQTEITDLITKFNVIMCYSLESVDEIMCLMIRSSSAAQGSE